MATESIANISTTNGTGYTKFPDGTLIGFGRISLTTVGDGDKTISETFNQPFTTTPYVVANQGSDSNTWSYLSIAATTISTTGFTIKANSFESGSSNVKISWIAIGRWK